MSVFTVAKAISLLSVILGVIGGLLTYKGGSGGGGLGAYANQALIDEVRRAGKRKHKLQKCGLILISVSLLFQGILLFIPTDMLSLRF